MGKYEGKRVLHLGKYGFTLDNISRLKKSGAYVIIGDNCPVSSNNYKDLVDEVIQLDINNRQEVIDYIKNNNIDAVVSNGNEDRNELLRIYNEAIGNTYYHTKEQWDIFTNKDNFRELCIAHNVDVPETYYSGNYDSLSKDIINTFLYPLIIKPVDSSGAKGISIVRTKRQLNKALKLAANKSKSRKIIIEKFLTGKEVTFTYVIQDETVKLVTCADKYCHTNRNGLSVIPNLYFYPCQDYKLFLNDANNKIISMIKSQKLNNCTIFFQGIEKDQKFYIFESGLRYEGTLTYLHTSHFYHQNYSDFLFDYLLKVKTDYDINKEDPSFNGHHSVTFIMHLKKGYIKKIEGIQYLKNNRNIFYTYIVKKEKKKIGNKPLDILFGGFSIDVESIEQLIKVIKEIKQTIKVKGPFGINLIDNSFDENILMERKF